MRFCRTSVKESASSRRRFALGSLIALLFSCAACSEPVKVPSSAAQDQVPKVNIGYTKYIVGTKQAPGDFKTATQSGTVQVPTADWNSQYLITASGSNPKGGVKELKLVIGQSGRALQTITTSQAIDTAGYALPSLSIIGTDGLGGIGPKAITLEPGSNPSLDATVTATNFNGQTASINVIFTIQPTPPSIKEFSVTPNDNDPSLGYINAGSTATLTWHVSCGAGVPGCNVALRGADGEPQYGHQTLFLPALGFDGTFKVAPVQNSKYTMTVTNSGNGNLSTSKSITVSIYNPPQMSNLQPFYFKMNCNSQVTPCFTLLVYAQTQDQAKQIAEQQNGGCTATSISAQDFVNGC